MAMIYRRNPHGNGHGTSHSTSGRVTTTISPHHSDISTTSHLDPDNNDKDDDDSPTSRLRLLTNWLRCRWWRRPKTATTVPIISPSSTSDLSHRISQILWLALLVYAFFGLPVLGRILNFCRYFHRFTVVSIAIGLIAGFLQDVAIFIQASTVIVLIKSLFHPHALHRRLSMASAASSSASSSTSAINGGANGSAATTALPQERYPHSYSGANRYVHLPVYFPVQTNEYEMPSSTTTSSSLASDSDTLDLPPTPPKHLTLVASSSSTATSFPWSHPSSAAPPARSSVFLTKLRTCSSRVIAVVLLLLVLVLATVASVADFCLQVTMHPRLNRAFVEIFVNYAEQFTASLMDEEVLTPPVVVAWTTYIALVVAITYAFYAERVPSLPDLLTSSSSSSSSLVGCFTTTKRLTTTCCSIVKRRSYRKDSSLMFPASSPLPHQADTTTTTTTDEPGFIKSLYQSYWRRKDSEMIIISEPTATASGSRGWRRRRNSGTGHGLLGLPGSSLSARFSQSTSATTPSWMTPKTPLGVVLHCVVVSVFVTLGALCVSLLVHTSASAMSQSGSKHRTRLGVDMQLMANPMFSLQTETFFTRKSRVGADHINCTAASRTLLNTLGKSEVFETENMGNDDSCAFLWRKTTAYQGETLWDINWNVTSITQGTPPVTVNDSSSSASTTSIKTIQKPPNIIVLNMESWRFLDVGVLGGAEKKKRFGKSATPNFDRFSTQGVLYRKHYTQCVQTTRTLLTTLFGMLPSCTETTALKMYGTGLSVQGLPQYLKSHGYFNMFWSAVDLSWEYWDEFLMMNGFDKLVDDTKIRQMLHDVKDYQDRDDDHFSWGMHDHLSFDMLLYALETAKNNTLAAAMRESDSVALHAANSSVLAMNMTVGSEDVAVAVPSPLVLKASSRMRTGSFKTETKPGLASVHGPENVTSDGLRNHTPPRIAGWEGLQEPFFIDMYTITSHNPWALPEDYVVPDLHELYTRFNKRYLDSMYFSDEMLGRFIDDLRAKGLMNNTIVIIEGDHGYGRLEHDNNPSIADSALYDEATHVPFLILADDFLAANERGLEIDQLTMQSDLMATIADIIGVSEAEPLLQHGYGHSMRRKRNPKAKVTDVEFDVIEEEQSEQEDRSVLLCNPFNGLTKGARTEELKYVFSPDGSYKVFELETDAVEKRPVQSGYDIDQMDEKTKEMLVKVSEQVDLNQFLFETNKFMTKIPPPMATAAPIATRHIEERPATRLAVVNGQRSESVASKSGNELVASPVVIPETVLIPVAAETEMALDQDVNAPSAKEAK